MTVLRYEPEMASKLTSFYNAAALEIPHCFPVSREDFALTVEGKLKHTRRLRRLEPDAAFVTMEEGLPTGFVHISPENTRTGRPTDRGVIRFLLYKRGFRRAGQALLDEAHTYLGKLGIKKITAFQTEYRYPFYHQLSAGLSNRMDHVQALLYVNGYRRSGSQIHFEWVDFDPVDPSPTELDLELEMGWFEGRPCPTDGIGSRDSNPPREAERPGLHLKAFANGGFVGECGCDPYVETRNLQQLQDWLYVGWLGIEEQYQGRGLGKHLLQRSLREMHAIGYRHAAISCTEENGRAFTLYSNCGFRVFDRTYYYERVCR